MLNWLSSWRRISSGSRNTAAEADRRVAPRVPVQQAVTVKFTADGHYEFTGISKDMSSSGMFLYAESQIKEGEQVELTLTLPPGISDPAPVKVRGRVVRLERASPVGFAIGFESLVVMPNVSE